MAGSFSCYSNLGWWSLLRSWNASSQGLLAFKASFDESVGFCLYILSWHFQYTAFAFVYLVFPLKYDKDDSFPVLFVWCPKSFCIWISISFPNWKFFFCGSWDKKEDIYFFYLCVSVYICVCMHTHANAQGSQKKYYWISWSLSCRHLWAGNQPWVFCSAHMNSQACHRIHRKVRRWVVGGIASLLSPHGS